MPAEPLIDRVAEMLAANTTGHLTLARSRGDSIILDTSDGPIVVKLTDRLNGAGTALLVSGPRRVKVLRWEVAERMGEAA